jgi:hypothetical protein
MTLPDYLELPAPNQRPNTDDFLALFYLPNTKTVKAGVEKPEDPLAFRWPAGVPNPSTLTSLHLI